MISVEHGNIIKAGTEAIVISANGCGILTHGVADAIREAGGESIGEEAKRLVAARLKPLGNYQKARDEPFKPGECYVTGSGKLRKRGTKNVYHAVTMEYPGGMTSIDFVCKAMRSALDKAIANGVKSIAIPGLGIGTGRLDKTTVAIRMARIAQEYQNWIEIVLLDQDKEFIDELKRFLGAE
ncbi:MAG: Appr-1-p processing protein [Candidatus Competibacteraceae bacterium]|nr:Appr-1-p processing protein [Candidatus Competibacteraceae bacterium]